MKTSKPFFSVVIPLYNKEKYLANTLTSLLNQRFQDFEVIIVNDGSTDKSLDIALSFSDPRIRIFSKENGGVSSARNFGFPYVNSNYIAFLDADDTWETSYLTEMKSLIERFPDCGFYACSYKVYEQYKVYDKCTHLPEGIVDNYFENEVKHEITRLSATVVPTAVFEETGGFPVGMVSGEDSYFCARIAIKHKIAFTPKTLVSYNKKFSGITLRYGKVDSCTESWFDLHGEENFYRDEFIADKALKAGVRYALGGHPQRGLLIEQRTKFTRLFKKKWCYLYILNRLPFQGVLLLKRLKIVYSLLKSLLSRTRNKTRKLNDHQQVNTQNHAPA